MATTTLIITSASFSPNPVEVGAKTKISVSVLEIVSEPETQVITAGEFTAGEV